MSKIEKRHLERAAFVYLRQSTMKQVQNNVESKKRQYALAERAEKLGWQEIRIIDEDLGRSGSGHVVREGFETVLAHVSQGLVGAIFAVEASRLARNGHEWHRLLEFCGIVDTLIVDHDGIYDPKDPNDRLLLGMKGTFSELEVGMFRQRSQEAIRQKAKRGEFYTRIAEGYLLADDATLQKDPDEHVQRSIELLFEKFCELGSARQVYLWFRQEEIKLPQRIGKWSPIDFVPATPWFVTRVLKDPAYAGAYAFGRTKNRVTIKEGRKHVVREAIHSPEDWEVRILDHHEAYISWSTYLRNLKTLAHNRNQMGEAVRGSARSGKGLLAGLVRCGHCGKKMQIQYSGRAGRNSAVVYYKCTASQKESIGKQLCHIIGGLTIERAVVEAVLEALSPSQMEIMALAAGRVARKRIEKHQQIELQLERAQYEADRCQRQYNSVEPENRLVVRGLETRWNRALEEVCRLEQELAELSTQQTSISPLDQEKLRSLAADLPRLWDHEAAPFDLKKRALRTVIKEIVVFVEDEILRVLVHWQGGQHTELSLPKRKSGEHRWKTGQSTMELIQNLARLMSDSQIAAQLNRMGIKSSRGHTWTRTRVGNFRKTNGISNYAPGERQARGELTIEEAAEKLGVSYSTVQRLIRRNQLPAQQVCSGAPWIIEGEDLDTLDNLRAAPSPAFSNQQTMIFRDDI